MIAPALEEIAGAMGDEDVAQSVAGEGAIGEHIELHDGKFFHFSPS